MFLKEGIPLELHLQFVNQNGIILGSLDMTFWSYGI